MSVRIRNIGPRSREWLLEVGVQSLDDLSQRGAVEVWASVKRLRPEASLNLLYALEAALADLDWRELDSNVKADLRRQANQLIPNV